MKKLLFLATGLITLASCSENDFVGDEAVRIANEDKAISFGSATPTVTRSDKEGATAATELNNNFVVFGYKTMTGDTKQTVFNNYQANYVASTGNTTESNSAGWEYVGYKNLTAANMTGNTGVAGNTTNGNEQTIKYWDYSASSYKFYAYSLGKGKTTTGESPSTTYANGSTMTTNDTYTLEGDQEQLAACYISELKTIDNPNGTTPTEVNLRFLSIKSKIQLGFYETIPGYSVKNLKFYESGTDNTSDGTPVLYAGSSTLPKAGTYTVTFDTKGKPTLTWQEAVSNGSQANVTFSSTLTNYATKDYNETAETEYLGRASNAATKTKEKDVLPYPDGAELTLKVDYTLVSRDGTGETIEVTGRTAKVPAAYTQWKPNYKYTYLFKITDDKLVPITLDAVVAESEDGLQETITTVAEPSITTYAKGQIVTSKNEYTTGSNIYVVVNKNSTVQTLTDTNAKLYSVTNTTGDGVEQEITEASVANALAHGTHLDANTWTVTGAGMKSLIITTAGVPTLTTITKIEADDSPTGDAITVNGAKFEPTTAGTYVFEYIDGTNKYYKIIKVVAP